MAKLCLEQIEVKLQEIVDEYYPEWPGLVESMTSCEELEKQVIADLQYADDRELFEYVERNVDILESFLGE